MALLDDLLRGAQETATRAFNQANPWDGGKNWNTPVARPQQRPQTAPQRPQPQYSPQVQQQFAQRDRQLQQARAAVYNPANILGDIAHAAQGAGQGLVNMGVGQINNLGNRVADFGQAGAEVIREATGQNQADFNRINAQAAEYRRMAQGFAQRAQNESNPVKRQKYIDQIRGLQVAESNLHDQNAQDLNRGLAATDPRKTLTNAAESALDVATLGKGKALLEGVKSTAAPITKEALIQLGKNAAVTSSQTGLLGASYSGINTARDPNATPQDYLNNMTQGAFTGMALGLGAQIAMPVAGKVAAKGAEVGKKQLDKAMINHQNNLYEGAAQSSPTINVRPEHINETELIASPKDIDAATKDILNGNAKPVIVTKDANGIMTPVANQHFLAAYQKIAADNIPTRTITPSQLKSFQQGGYVKVPGGETVASKKQLPKPAPGSASKENDLSRFTNKLMEEDRTAPIHNDLLKLSAHEIKRNKDVLEATAANIAKDEAEALRFAKNGSSTEANATSLQLLDKYLNEGRMDEASELIKTVAPRFTRQGQETQILAAYSKLSPVGALKLANHVVDHSAKNAPKLARLEDETHIATKQITDANKEAARQVSNELTSGRLGTKAPLAPKADGLTPEERLAKRINATSDKKNAAPDPITDMVNTLHKVAKESLHNKGKSTPRNPMKLVGLAIKNKAEYADIWQKAKDLVAEKYKGNESALAELDTYFAKQLDKPFSQAQLNKGVQNGLKGVDLGKIVRKHYTVADEAGRDLKAKLIQEAGLSEAEAGQLASSIQARFNELTKAKKESIIKQMFGEKATLEQKSAADRIIEMSNLGALGRDDLRPLVAQKLKMEGLSKEAASEINRRAQALQTMEEGSPERLRATAEMMQYIAKQAPSGTLDKLLGSWTAGLISGAKTITGAPASNATNTLLGAVTNPVAAGLDASRSFLTGAARENTVVSPIHYFKGFAKGLPEAGRYLRTGIDERAPVTDMQREINFKHKLPSVAVNGTFRLMGALDRPFYYGQKALSEAEFAKLNRLNKDKPAKLTSDEQAQAIESDARKSVLDYDTLLSKVASAMKQAADKSDTAVSRGVGKVATTINSPFVRIPSAGLARMIDYSPVGAPIHALRQAAEMRWGGQKEFSWRDMNKAMAESSVGTGVVVLGYALAANNRVSGEYPSSDPKEQARWAAEGITPNSVKIGNTWTSLNYLGPVGSLIQQGKRFHDGMESGQGVASSALAAEVGVGRDALNQSYLQGVNNAMEATRDPERNLPSYVNGLASSVVPSAVNDVANMLDSNQRQVNNPAEAIMGRLPLVRNTLNPKQDVYGNDLKQRTDPVNLTVNPLKPSNQNSSVVLDEVKRLHLADPNNKDLQVTPSKQDKNANFGGTGTDGKPVQTKLSTQQVYDLQKQVGQAINTEWSKLIQTDQYKGLDDIDKAAALDSLRKKVAKAEGARYAIAQGLGQYAQDFTGKKKSLGKDEQSFLTGQPNITKFAKAKSDSTSSTTAIANTLKSTDKDLLTKYDTLSSEDKKQYAYSSPDAEFKYAVAKYNNDKANGKISDIQDIKKRQELAKLEVGSKVSKNTRDLYSLSKAQIYQYITTHDNGDKLAKELQDYDQKLYDAGLSSSLKFKTGMAPATRKASSGRKSSGGRKGKTTVPATTAVSTGLASFAKASSAARNAKVAKKSLPGVKISGGKMAAYKKPAKTNVSMTRKA